MAFIETRLHRDHWEVGLRLSQMDLVRSKLVTVAETSRTEALNSMTNFHAANASGTLAYQSGIFALRHQFVSRNSDWKVDRAEGVESIRHDRLRLRIGFSNVDVACKDDYVPQPRTSKGSGAERICHPDLFGGALPTMARKPADGEWAFYYLMLDENGLAELTRPVVKSGAFHSAIERIYLIQASDASPRIDMLDDLSDVVSDFDPKIERKE